VVRDVARPIVYAMLAVPRESSYLKGGGSVVGELLLKPSNITAGIRHRIRLTLEMHIYLTMPVGCNPRRASAEIGGRTLAV